MIVLSRNLNNDAAYARFGLLRQRTKHCHKSDTPKCLNHRYTNIKICTLNFHLKKKKHLVPSHNNILESCNTKSFLFQSWKKGAITSNRPSATSHTFGRQTKKDITSVFFLIHNTTLSYKLKTTRYSSVTHNQTLFKNYYKFQSNSTSIRPLCYYLDTSWTQTPASTSSTRHFYVVLYKLGDCGSTVVKVLCYKSEGRWFDPSWCH